MADAPRIMPRLKRAMDRAMSERERQVLTLLRRDGAMSRSALIRETGLSGTAIFRVTEDLVRAGHVRLGEPVKEGRGQPSNLVEIVPGSALALGIAVMTDTAEAVLMDLSGTVVARANITRPRMARQEILEAAREFAHDTCADSALDAARIEAVGVALAGFFTGKPGHLNPAAALDDWALRDLRADAETVLARPVMVENIANAAAVGEALLGAGQNHRSFAYVSVASGFGGGYVLNGEPWRGAFGNAGEFAALLKHAGQRVPNLETLRETLSRAGIATDNVGDLVARYDPDWPGLEDWIGDTKPAFRMLAHLIHFCVDVEAVIIGGRLPTDLARRIAEAAAIDPADRSARIRRGVPHPDPIILAAETGPLSYAIGAAALPLSARFFTSLAQLRTS